MRTASDPLSRAFAALADPTRRAIVARLATGSATVNELAAPFAMSRPAVSQHLKVLRNAGLVAQTANAQWRTCSLRTEALTEVQQWVGEQRAAWNVRFDRLDEQLADLIEGDDR